MITVVKAFPNPQRRRHSPFISYTLGKVLVIDENLDFPATSGFVEVEILEERGDSDRGVFTCRVLRVLADEADHPIHLPPSFYTKVNCDGIVIITPNSPSPTGYILPANVKQSLLRPRNVYAVVVEHGRPSGGWSPKGLR